MCAKTCPTLSGQSLCRKRCYWETFERPPRFAEPPASAVTNFLKQGLAPRDVARIFGTEVDYVEQVAKSIKLSPSRA